MWSGRRRCQKFRNQSPIYNTTVLERPTVTNFVTSLPQIVIGSWQSMNKSSDSIIATFWRIAACSSNLVGRTQIVRQSYQSGSRSKTEMSSMPATQMFMWKTCWCSWPTWSSMPKRGTKTLQSNELHNFEGSETCSISCGQRASKSRAQWQWPEQYRSPGQESNL